MVRMQEIVQSYQYLGLYINSKLDWSKNTLAICKKGHFPEKAEVIWCTGFLVEWLLAFSCEYHSFFLH